MIKIPGLKLKAPKYDNSIELRIQGDENDGDYVEETSSLSLEDFNKVFPILKKIMKARDSRVPYHNWDEREEYLTEEELEVFEEIDLYVPSGNSDNSIHSIVEIEAWYLSKDDNVRYEIQF